MDDEMRHATESRLALLGALILGQEHAPELIGIVIASPDTTAAITAVRQRFGLDPQLATALLHMQVRRFSASERTKIIEERDELRRQLNP